MTISCVSDSEERVPDVSRIEVDAEIIRVDSMLNSVQSISDLSELEHQLSTFYELYFRRILRLPNAMNQDSLWNHVQSMRRNTTFVRIQELVSKEYADISDIRTDWDLAMKYYKHYFPATDELDMYTVLSEFGYSSFIFSNEDGHDAVGVSLDMYLGDSVNYASMSAIDPSFSAYHSRAFNRNHLVKKAVDAIIQDRMPQRQSGEFLDRLIEEGKKVYVLDKLLPFVHDTVIWEQSQQNWTWIRNNEWNIYTFLIDEDLLYSRSGAHINRLLQSSPHSPGMPPEAPGRASVYIGYQIVDAFMRKNPNMGLQGLMSYDDADKMLKIAKYKPAR